MAKVMLCDLRILLLKAKEKMFTLKTSKRAFFENLLNFLEENLTDTRSCHFPNFYLHVTRVVLR